MNIHARKTTLRARLRVAALVSGASLAMMFAASTVQAKEVMKYLYPWSPALVSNEEMRKWMFEEIKKDSKGDIEFRLFGPSVVPPFQQLQPVSSGAFDIHFTSPAYHGKDTGIGQLGDTVDPDPEKRRSSGFWDAVDKYYQTKHRLKVIANAGAPGYQILLKEAIGEDGGLKGRKIRSNPAYDSLIRHLGGSPVTLPPAQIYTSLQKGLVDGSAWPLHSLQSQKFNEVVKFMARPVFGRSTNLLLMNLAKWNALKPEQQKALLAVGRKLEDVAMQIPARIAAEDEAFMLKSGAQLTNYSAEHAKRINEIYNAGIWERVIKQHGDDAKLIVDIIQKSGVALK